MSVFAMGKLYNGCGVGAIGKLSENENHSQNVFFGLGVKKEGSEIWAEIGVFQRLLARDCRALALRAWGPEKVAKEKEGREWGPVGGWGAGGRYGDLGGLWDLGTLWLCHVGTPGRKGAPWSVRSSA